MSEEIKPHMKMHTFQAHAFRSLFDVNNARRRVTRMIENWPERRGDLLPILENMLALEETLEAWKEED